MLDSLKRSEFTPKYSSKLFLYCGFLSIANHDGGTMFHLRLNSILHELMRESQPNNAQSLLTEFSQQRVQTHSPRNQLDESLGNVGAAQSEDLEVLLLVFGTVSATTYYLLYEGWNNTVGAMHNNCLRSSECK